jgi:hypothetical protein
MGGSAAAAAPPPEQARDNSPRLTPPGDFVDLNPQTINWENERDLVRKAGTAFLENMARLSANEAGALEDSASRIRKKVNATLTRIGIINAELMIRDRDRDHHAGGGNHRKEHDRRIIIKKEGDHQVQVLPDQPQGQFSREREEAGG